MSLMKVQEEFARFKAEKKLPGGENPLMWQKTHEHCFLKLARQLWEGGDFLIRDKFTPEDAKYSSHERPPVSCISLQ